MADTAGSDADWCWGTQVADALAEMKKLAAQAIAAGADALNPDARTSRTNSSAPRSSRPNFVSSWGIPGVTFLNSPYCET